MKPTIAVFLHHPTCAVDCANATIKSLSSNYYFKIITKHELDDNFFDDVDIVAVPGGIGDAENFSYLMKINKEPIRKFIKGGGRYLGICMGAYWAGKHYFDILDGLDSVQYITRPNTDTRRPHAKNLKVTWNGEEEHMYFYDGCTFVGNGEHKVISRYCNNDPMAIMQGRIGLIGCHPESQENWYDQYSWLNGKWHGGKHNELLLQFTDELMKQP